MLSDLIIAELFLGNYRSRQLAYARRFACPGRLSRSLHSHVLPLGRGAMRDVRSAKARYLNITPGRIRDLGVIICNAHALSRSIIHAG